MPDLIWHSSRWLGQSGGGSRQAVPVSRACCAARACSAGSLSRTPPRLRRHELAARWPRPSLRSDSVPQVSSETRARFALPRLRRGGSSTAGTEGAAAGHRLTRAGHDALHQPLVTPGLGPIVRVQTWMPDRVRHDSAPPLLRHRARWFQLVSGSGRQPAFCAGRPEPSRRQREARERANDASKLARGRCLKRCRTAVPA
jgi:hypothetical protein